MKEGEEVGLSDSKNKVESPSSCRGGKRSIERAGKGVQEEWGAISEKSCVRVEVPFQKKRKAMSRTEGGTSGFKQTIGGGRLEEAGSEETETTDQRVRNGGELLRFFP